MDRTDRTLTSPTAKKMIKLKKERLIMKTKVHEMWMRSTRSKHLFHLPEHSTVNTNCLFHWVSCWLINSGTNNAGRYWSTFVAMAWKFEATNQPRELISMKTDKRKNVRIGDTKITTHSMALPNSLSAKLKK